MIPDQTMWKACEVVKAVFDDIQTLDCVRRDSDPALWGFTLTTPKLSYDWSFEMRFYGPYEVEELAYRLAAVVVESRLKRALEKLS